MPLVQISVSEKISKERRTLLPQAVYDAMRTAISIPDGDMFVTVTAHGEGEIVADPTYLGMQRGGEFTVVRITLRQGRTPELKQALYAEVARLFEERAQIRPDDVMIVLSENDALDWSFGKGVAQYAPKTGAAS